MRRVYTHFGEEFIGDPIFLAQNCLRYRTLINGSRTSVDSIALGRLQNLFTAARWQDRRFAASFAGAESQTNDITYLLGRKAQVAQSILRTSSI